MKKLRILLLVAFLVALAIGSGMFAARTEKKETVYGAFAEENIEKVQTILSRDEDGDGLKDWEEELWGTEKAVSDTDGDGTDDGAEIAEGRDPLKKGPLDRFDIQTIETKTTVPEQETTLTDRLARDFFADYLALKKGGRELTAEDERALLLSMFNDPPPLGAVEVVEITDLAIIPKTDRPSLAAYGNELVGILQKYSNRGENELVIFTNAVETEDPQELLKLDERVGTYRALRDELAEMEVPSPFGAYHKDLVNAFAAMRTGVESMKFILADPARALGGIGSYPSGLELLTDTLQSIGRVLKEKGVTFEAGEPGGELLK